MDVNFISDYCLLFSGASNMIQWESALLFKVGGKMFAVYSLSPAAKNLLSIKCDKEKFQELVEQEGIIQAPYFAKGQWICLCSDCRLKAAEIKLLISESYQLVFEKLPKKIQKEVNDSFNKAKKK